MEKEILKVQMLGGFSLVYQGKTLVFERNYTSKSMQLLQLLFLHLENGIEKSVFWLNCMAGKKWKIRTEA